MKVKGRACAHSHLKLQLYGAIISSIHSALLMTGWITCCRRAFKWFVFQVASLTQQLSWSVSNSPGRPRKESGLRWAFSFSTFPVWTSEQFSESGTQGDWIMISSEFSTTGVWTRWCLSLFCCIMKCRRSVGCFIMMSSRELTLPYLSHRAGKLR